MQFRAEAFNFANITNYGSPSATLDSPATITAIQGNQRELQLALKLLF
jgi:hypothetical protein